LRRQSRTGALAALTGLRPRHRGGSRHCHSWSVGRRGSGWSTHGLNIAGGVCWPGLRADVRGQILDLAIADFFWPIPTGWRVILASAE
jgi:hypothetical protein